MERARSLLEVVVVSLAGRSRGLAAWQPQRSDLGSGTRRARHKATNLFAQPPPPKFISIPLYYRLASDRADAYFQSFALRKETASDALYLQQCSVLINKEQFCLTYPITRLYWIVSTKLLDGSHPSISADRQPRLCSAEVREQWKGNPGYKVGSH